jgi:hypothetical protein
MASFWAREKVGVSQEALAAWSESLVSSYEEGAECSIRASISGSPARSGRPIRIAEAGRGDVALRGE